MSSVTSLNVSDNPLQSIASTVRQLALAMPHLKDLQISLFREEDVEYVITHMPSLQFLNNLPVERSKKWETEESQSTVKVQTSQHFSVDGPAQMLSEESSRNDIKNITIRTQRQRTPASQDLQT